MAKREEIKILNGKEIGQIILRSTNGLKKLMGCLKNVIWQTKIAVKNLNGRVKTIKVIAEIEKIGYVFVYIIITNMMVEAETKKDNL